MSEWVPFGSDAYFVLLAALVFSRGADFFSTWLATPNLVLEANPIARKLGWKGGLAANIVLCGGFATWPLPAIIIITSSLLVAARNFQSAWLMRSMGEEHYRHWMTERFLESDRRVYWFCVFAQAGLFCLVGGALMYFSQWRLVPFAVGAGFITYAVAVAVFTSLAVWRMRRFKISVG